MDSSQGDLLYLRGRDIAYDLKHELEGAGFQVVDIVMYEAIAVEEFSPEVQYELRGQRIDGVILFSPRTAQLFVQLTEKGNLVQYVQEINCFCMSEAVAENLSKLGGGNVHVPNMPTLNNLLALIDRSASNLV